MKTPLRWSGALFLLGAVAWAAHRPVPDVLVAGDGRSFAVRGADGRLALHHIGSDSFATKEWLAADADGRDAHDHGVGEGISCDTSGCIGKLADRALVAYVTAPDAFEEDCRRALLVIAARGAPPPGCAATVITRKDWRAHGALALRRTETGFVTDAVRPAGYDRPWSPAPALRQTASNAVVAAKPAAARTTSRDATPRPEDIEADQ